FADRLIALHLIDQTRDVDLHCWTPVRGWDIGGHQYTTSSHSTTLESNKSHRKNGNAPLAYWAPPGLVGGPPGSGARRAPGVPAGRQLPPPRPRPARYECPAARRTASPGAAAAGD